VAYSSNCHASQTDVRDVQVNRVFGAGKFEFYVESCSPELQACLAKYRRLGIVDIQPWSMPQPLLHSEVSVDAAS